MKVTNIYGRIYPQNQIPRGYYYQVHANLMKLNKDNFNMLHLSHGNPWYQYKQGDEGMESRGGEGLGDTRG